MINLFKHTSRTYYDVYNALIAAYPQKPTWLFKEMGGLFDFSSELLNRVATDILYPQTRESAYAFANLCDYSPVESDGATTTLTITLTSAMAKTLAIGYQVAGTATATGNTCIYELTAEGNSGSTNTITVAAKQKQTKATINLGIITSSDDFADYPINGYINIIKDSFGLKIDSLAWTLVDNFDESEATDRHFILIFQSSGKVRIGFGDDINGMKPTINSVMYGTFEVTQGSLGRMGAGEITLNIGGDSDILSITNSSATIGGNDAEGISSIIRNARANVRLKDAVWSQEDLEISAKMANTDVAKALGVPALGSASVVVVPIGNTTSYPSGFPTTDLKNAVVTYIQALTQFGLFPITCSDPTYREVDITASVTARSGYVLATVEDLVDFALTLATCPFDIEIIDSYNDDGISICRTSYINVYWGDKYSFTEDDEPALAFIIDKWIYLLGDYEYRDFGQSLEVGALWQMGDSLIDYGVQEFSLDTVDGSTPVNITISSDEMIKTGTITIN